MPPNAAAAATTERFRQRLLRLRDAVSRSVALQLREIELDAGKDATRRSLALWERSAALLVTLAQSEAGRLADVYISAYMSAGGVTPEAPAAVAQHVGVDLNGRPVEESLRAAPVAFLWRLGRGDGRPAAYASGMDRAIRVTRGAVMATARGVIAERAESERRITGWRRVSASDPCGACLARSGVLMTSQNVFETHDRCNCTAEVVLLGVPERVKRQTGQERWDAMSPDQRAQLLAGAGGAQKAALITDVNQLVAHSHGQMVEAPLASLAQ